MGGQRVRGARLSFGEARSSRPGPVPANKGASAPDRFPRGERPEPGARAPESAKREVPRVPAFLLSTRPQSQRARPPAPRSRSRAMLHLGEFSSSDALLVKSAEGCCSEPSTELPRLPARDAPAATGYPGGKERGQRCSDSDAVRGRTMPENENRQGLGLGRRRRGGRHGRGRRSPGVRTAITTPRRAASVSTGNRACIKASLSLCTCVLRVHVCVCALGLMPAPTASECAKGTLYV